MNIFSKILLVVASVSLLNGCSAIDKSIKHGTLDVQTRMSETVFLDPVADDKKTVILQIRNTSDKKDLEIQSEIKIAIEDKGYKIVTDPNKAHYMIQANILQVGKSIKEEDIRIEAKKITLKKVNWTDVLIRFNDEFIVTINYVPEQFYQLFEMDFKFEKGRIHFQDFEQRLSIEKKTINTMNENILKLSSDDLPTQEVSNMFGLIQEMELFFQNKTTLADYSINAIEKSMKLYFKMIPYYED